MNRCKDANELVNLLINTLDNNKVNYDLNDFFCFDSIKKRNEGIKFEFSDHLKGIVYALLGSQRTWEGIKINFTNIDQIFYQFDKQLFDNTSPEEIVFRLKLIRCGNKNIRRQIEGLIDIICILNIIEKRYGSLDNFITHDQPIEISILLTKSREYKLKGLGSSLVFDYLRNVGIDVAKPDTHLMRMFGPDRLRIVSSDNFSQHEVVKLVDELAYANNMSSALLGTTFWLLCAKGYGNICCATPKCELCEFHKTFCYY